MKVKYDREVDILYIRLTDNVIGEIDETHAGTIIDYGVDGAVVGIEVLNASRRMAKPKSVELGFA